MKAILKIYTRIIVLLFPLFFLPVIYDGFGLGKSSFLVATGLVGLVLWLIDLLVNKREVVKLNKFWGWFLLLAVWGLVSFLKLPPGGEMRALINTTGFGFVLGLLVWSFLWLQITDKEEYKKQLVYLSISGVVVGLTSILTFMIPNTKLPLVWPKKSQLISIDQGWSMVGSILGEIVLFLFLSWEWIKKLLKKLKNKTGFNEYFKEAISVVFFGLLLFLDIYKTIKIGWNYLDNKTAWVIATEVLKNSPIFGVGLGNFAEAFLKFRPASFNLTKLWAMTFDRSSMGILQIWTELGLGGLVLLFLAVKGWLKQWGKKSFWEMGFLGLLVLLLPLNAVAIFLLVWFVANKSSEVKETKMTLKIGENGLNVMPYLVTVVVLVGVGLVGFNLVKITLADYYWRESLVAASKNDGLKTYNLQIKAIGLNPSMADYRLIYSQTNLALAQSFLTKKDLTDEEKQKVSTLVQQSVREAKAAISLNGGMANYWTNLAIIYKSLIGTVDGTADWSVQSYQQAILLDPANVSLYMDLGGLYYAAGDFASADKYFEKAVTVKNDYANTWYNWSYSAKGLNNLQAAVDRMTQALKLVPADSTDYQKANDELTKWKTELEAATKKAAAPVTTTDNKTTTETIKQDKTVVPDKTQVENPTDGNKTENLAPPTVVPTVKPEQ
jgi:Tfp pilus assembly protein PilF